MSAQGVHAHLGTTAVYQPAASASISAPIAPSWPSLADLRRHRIQEAFSSFTDLHCSPRRDVLQEVCRLNIDDFPKQSPHLVQRERIWTVQHVPALPQGTLGSYYVTREDQTLNIVIPTWRIRKWNKDAWEAIQVTYDRNDACHVVTTPVFRATMPLDLDKAALTLGERDRRLDCNRSPHFPQLYYYGRINCKPHPPLLMTVEEFYAYNLEEFIASHPDILENEMWVVDRLIDILEALIYLHQLGYVYVDMKQPNILISREGTKAALTDLGLAIRIGSVAELRATPALAAPEIVDKWIMGGKKERIAYTPQFDMWGFGMVAYELLSRILKLPTPAHQQSQYDMIQHQIEKKKRQAQGHFPQWNQNVKNFIDSFEGSWQPLKIWLGAILKRNSAERLTSVDALANLKAYRKTLSVPQLTIGEIQKFQIAVPADLPAVVLQKADIEADKEAKVNVERIIKEFEENLLDRTMLLENEEFPSAPPSTVLRRITSWSTTSAQFLLSSFRK